MRNKKVSIFLGALFAITVALFVVSKGIVQANENQAASKQDQSNEQFNLNDPLKFLFVTDKNTPTVSVFDIDKNDVVDKISLSEKADFISVSPLQKTLFYAQRNGQKLYHLNLATRTENHYDLTMPIQYLSVKADGKWIVYANEHKTVVLNSISKKSFDIATQGRLSFVFQPNANVLFIGELDEGKVFRVDLVTQKITKLADLAVSISDLSIMPNSLALYFNADSQLYRYALLDEQLQTFNLGETKYRPYITADSRKLLSLSQSSESLISFNTYALKEVQRYSLDTISHLPNRIVTGWLEQVAIVIGEKALHSFYLDGDSKKTTKLEHQVESMVVHADSKTLFATLQGSEKILIFDIKSQSVIDYIDSQIEQPDRVFMLQSNTLCH